MSRGDETKFRDTEPSFFDFADRDRGFSQLHA